MKIRNTHLRLFACISFLLFICLACDTKKEDMNIISSYMQKCTSELIETNQKDSSRYKDFRFQETEFTLFIDSTGKPVFSKDSSYIDEIFLMMNENQYKISLIEGQIKVYWLN